MAVGMSLTYDTTKPCVQLDKLITIQNHKLVQWTAIGRFINGELIAFLSED
jgi:hypothetical protein